MSDGEFRLLPEGTHNESIVDDVEFSDVTEAGEVYTLYRIVRFTHEAADPLARWTHLANVARVRSPAIGVARLRIRNRVIEDSQVTLSPEAL